jgi:hypothetical protein
MLTSLGAAAFAQLTMETPDGIATDTCSPRDATLSAERLLYRQVADPLRPVFFLRNPSRVYGLSNMDYIAEKAFASVSEILKADSADMSSRVLQTYVDVSLKTRV